MVLKHAARTTMGDRVLSQFIDLLNSGVYVQSQKLPSESVMCEQLHVSRPVLREALRILRFLGYIETIQGGGTYICNKPLNPTFAGIKLRLALDETQAFEVWELRYVIEAEAAGFAAARATDEEIKRIQKAAAEYGNAVAADSSGDDIIALTQKFHNEIAFAAHNSILTRTLEDISNLLIQSRKFSIQVENSSERATMHHQRIANAIADRNVSGAKEAMRQHLLDVHKDLLRYMENRSRLVGQDGLLRPDGAGGAAKKEPETYVPNHLHTSIA